MLTINFYTQLALKALYKSKTSFTKESVLNTNEDILKNSIGPEALEYSVKKGTKQKNKGSISIKHKIANNPDFVDVYKEDNNEESPERNKIEVDSLFPEDNPKKGGLPLMTEPDASHHLGK